MSDDDAGPDGGDRRVGFFSKLKTAFGGPGHGIDGGDDQSSVYDSVDDDRGGEGSNSRRAMIERVIEFGEKKVVDVMAPRADVFAVDIETPLNTLIKTFADAGHSRMPIYRGDLDDPIGMVHIKDLIGFISDGRKTDDGPVLKQIRRDLLYTPPSMRITDLLLRMQASRIHMALVIDEYGGTDGLVTIEDLVEEIVGDINDEHDIDDDPMVIAAPGGGWDADARLDLDDFEEDTGLKLDPEDDEIETIGGYVVSLAGRVPQRGEIITGPSGYDFEVMEADARKLRRVRIRPSVRVPSEAAE